MKSTIGILIFFTFVTACLASFQLQCVVKGSSRAVGTAVFTIAGTTCGNGVCRLQKGKQYGYVLEFSPGIPNMRNVDFSATINGLEFGQQGSYGLSIIKANRKCTDLEKGKRTSNCSLDAKKKYEISSNFSLDKNVKDVNDNKLISFSLNLQDRRAVDADYAQCIGLLDNVVVV